jgi:hypothetical protein
VAFQLVDEFAGVGVELVDNLVVSARQDSPTIFAKLNARESAIFAGKFLYAEPRGEVPEFGYSVTTSRDDKIPPKLNSIDRSPVASQLLEELTSFPIPNTEESVLGAGDNVSMVETDVKNTRSVASKAADGSIVVLHVPDDAGVIRRSGDHDLLIKLEAENRRLMVVRGRGPPGCNIR